MTSFSRSTMLNISFGNRWDGGEDAKVYKLTAVKTESELVVKGLNEIENFSLENFLQIIGCKSESSS